VVGVPGRIVEEAREPRIDLDHNRLPDPVAEAIRLVLAEHDKLADRVKQLEASAGLTSPDNDLLADENKVKKEFIDRYDI
jgi:serine O-acetyltransferase